MAFLQITSVWSTEYSFSTLEHRMKTSFQEKWSMTQSFWLNVLLGATLEVALEEQVQNLTNTTGNQNSY